MEKAIKRFWPVFVIPTFAAFAIGFIWPFLQGLYLSFCRFITIDTAQWNGIQNYIYALTEESFLHSFWFTALFTVVSTICINVAAFAIALALTRGIKGTNVFRSVFFMPNLIAARSRCWRSRCWSWTPRPASGAWSYSCAGSRSAT